jgi:quinol monooxygenase YgiN
MIHVLATIELAPKQREKFLEEFHRLVPKVHAEKGCIEYGPAVDAANDLPHQPEARPDTVVVIEKWADLNALKAHLQAPHMADYRERVKDLVRAVQLQILRPA